MTVTAGTLPHSEVSIVEVGPRDGLQNETVALDTSAKIRFVDLLAQAGATRIEVTSFVSPRLVPQMSDAAEVCAGITRYPGVQYSALVPNRIGLERAMRAGLSHVAIFAAASETFSLRNLRQSIDAAFAVFADVTDEALGAGLHVRGYLSTSFGCPFEGEVSPARVAELTGRLLDLGVFEVAVSDTIGVAHPGSVSRVLDAVLARTDAGRVALHFHDTRGTALANILTGLERGIRTFDSSAGGLGGCPFAPGATGNVATEDVVYMLEGMGIATGIDLNRLVTASASVESALATPLPSRCYRAMRAGPPVPTRSAG